MTEIDRLINLVKEDLDMFKGSTESNIRSLVNILEHSRTTVENQNKELERLNIRIDARESNNTALRRELSKSKNEISSLISTIESQKEEIEKLREIQRALVLTPMQKMSRSMDIISQFQKGEK
jgi:predicted  nucleic acid-binding Zn-ribbon protein